MRVLFICNALPIIGDHPVVGAGPGRYGGAVSARFPTSPLYEQYTACEAPVGRTVDNFWLHLVVEFGILGALLFGSILAYVIGQLVWAARHAAGLTRVLLSAFAAAGMILVLDSVTEMLLEGNTTSFSMWFFLGIGAALVLAEHRRGTKGGGATVEAPLSGSAPQTL